MLTSWYGGYGGSNTSSLDQGRISGISSWGVSSYSYVGTIVISSWSSDSQTNSNSFGSNSFTSCTAFTLDSDDYIIGHQIWWDTYIYGIEFYTLNGETYSCYDSSYISGKYSQYAMYECDDDDFYYLTGFHAKTGSIIDGMKLQYTKYKAINESEYLFDNNCECTISDYGSSGTYDTGTNNGGFVSDTNDTMGPWYGESVHFLGDTSGGNLLVFDYEIECAIPCRIIDFTVEGAAWWTDTITLYKKDTNTSNILVEYDASTGDDSFLSYTITPNEVYYGTLFRLQQTDDANSWRYRSSLSMTLQALNETG